ncbi:RNA-binding protein, putative [Plasmodium vinckei lentum]|uniref:RNA-binding protein, putative n=1 Tax=Plasmodium vinckei lentum TaxID=138297 RepID=A0A6V7RZ77_PLAVN|nr:RNA-binding protein, putative [Plasmodium vinckei lentum]
MWFKKFTTEKESAPTNNDDNQNLDQEVDYTDKEDVIVDEKENEQGDNGENVENINDGKNDNAEEQEDEQELDQNEVNEKIQSIINDLSSDEEEGEVVEDEIPYERVQEKNEKSKEIILLNYYSEISENKLNTLLNIFGNVKSIYTDDNECTHIIFHSIKSAINAKKYIDNLKIKSRRVQVIYGKHKDDSSNRLRQKGDANDLNENDEINKTGYDYTHDKFSKVPVKLYKNKNFYSNNISDHVQKNNKYPSYKNYINDNQIHIKNKSYIRGDNFASPDKNILLPNSKSHAHMNTHRSRNNYDQSSYNNNINSEHGNIINNKGDAYPPPPPPPSFFSYNDNNVNSMQNINNPNYSLYNSTNHKVNKHFDTYSAHPMYINNENTSNIYDNEYDDNYINNIRSNKYKTDLKPNNKYDSVGKGLYNTIVPPPPYLNKDDKKKLYKNSLNSPNKKFTHIDHSTYPQNYSHIDFDAFNNGHINNNFYLKNKDNYMDFDHNNRKKKYPWKTNFNDKDFNEFRFDEDIQEDYQFDEENPFNINSENVMIDNPTWLVRKNTPAIIWDQSASIKDNHINYVNSFINEKLYNRYLLITNIPPDLNENNKLKNYVNELLSVENKQDACIEASIFTASQDDESNLFKKNDKEEPTSGEPKEAAETAEATEAVDPEPSTTKQAEPKKGKATKGRPKRGKKAAEAEEAEKGDEPNENTKMYAHLTFKTIKNAVDAKKELEEKSFKVTFSSPNKANNCLWVGNIMKNYYMRTYSILKTMLKEYGEIINIKFVIEKNCLFLQYKEIEFAIKARNHLYGIQLSNNIFLNIDFSTLGEWEGKQKSSFARKKLLDLLLYDNNFLEYKLEKKYNEKNMSFFCDSNIMKILQKNMAQTNSISGDRYKMFKNNSLLYNKNKIDSLYRDKTGKRITTNRLLDKKNNMSYKKSILNNKTNSIYDKNTKKDGGKLYKRKIDESEKNSNEYRDRKKKRDIKDEEHSSSLYKKKNNKNNSQIDDTQNQILFNCEDLDNAQESDENIISFYVNQKYKCDFNVSLFEGNPKLAIYSKLNVETKSDIKNLKHIQATCSDHAIWKIHPTETQKKKFYHICDHFNKKTNIPVVLTKKRMIFIVPPKDEYLADLGVENLDGMYAYVFEAKKT